MVDNKTYTNNNNKGMKNVAVCDRVATLSSRGLAGAYHKKFRRTTQTNGLRESLYAEIQCASSNAIPLLFHLLHFFGT